MKSNVSFALLAASAFALPCWGQTYTLSIEEVEGLPGEAGLAVHVLGSFSEEIHGVQVALSYRQAALDLVDIRLEGTALEGVPIEGFTYAVDPTTGLAWAQVLIDTEAPFEGLPAAENAPLFTLVFDVEAGLPPGEELEVGFAEQAGDPPVQSAYFVLDGSVTPTTTGGLVRITNDNFLIAKDATVLAGERGVPLEFIAINTSPLMGFSLAVRFDPDVLAVAEVHIRDTITDAVKAEFVEPIIRNDEGYFILGVLLDAVPPFEDQRIPATGLDLVIARAEVDVDEDALIDRTEIVFEDGLGSPPISNRFVIDSQSVAPRTLKGVVTVLHEIPFVRGDANADGRVNVADPVVIVFRVFRGLELACDKAADADDDGEILVNDPVYLLQYLFRHGPEPPAPFPEAGLDPTPDDLPCVE